MPKKADSELQKHTMNFRAGDVQAIQALYPDIGASIIIRKLVSSFVDRVQVEGDTPKVSVKL